jgi:hypothetical protein
VDGSFSTCIRLGDRWLDQWLNVDRSWIVGLNAGYDRRTIASGNADTNVPRSLLNNRILFHQITVNVDVAYISSRIKSSMYYALIASSH